MGAQRYRMRKIGMGDLARTDVYIVTDTQAECNSVIAVFSESKHGTDARRLAKTERDRLNHAMR